MICSQNEVTFSLFSSCVNPVFVIQVANAVGSRVSATDLDECIRIIE